MSVYSSPKDSEVLVRLATGLTQLVLYRYPKSERLLNISSEIWGALQVWPDINALLHKLSHLGLDPEEVQRTISNISLGFMMEHGAVSKADSAQQDVGGGLSRRHSSRSSFDFEPVDNRKAPIRGHWDGVNPFAPTVPALPEVVHRPNSAPQIGIDTRQVASVSNLRLPVQTSVQAKQVLQQLEYTVYTPNVGSSEETKKAYAEALLRFLKRPILSASEKSAWKLVRDRLQKVNSYYTEQKMKEEMLKDQELQRQRQLALVSREQSTSFSPIEPLSYSAVPHIATTTPQLKRKNESNGASKEFLEIATNIILDICTEKNTSPKVKKSFVFHTLYRLSREGPPQSIDDYPWWNSFSEWQKKTLEKVSEEQDRPKVVENAMVKASIETSLPTSVSHSTNNGTHIQVQSDTKKRRESMIVSDEQDINESIDGKEAASARMDPLSANKSTHVRKEFAALADASNQLDTSMDDEERRDKIENTNQEEFLMASLPHELKPTAQPESGNFNLVGEMPASEEQTSPNSFAIEVPDVVTSHFQDRQRDSQISSLEEESSRQQQLKNQTSVTTESQLLRTVAPKTRSAAARKAKNRKSNRIVKTNATHLVKEDITTAALKMNKAHWRPPLNTDKSNFELDVSTIARDVLRAVGRHPDFPTLNASLLYLKDLGLTDRTTDLARVDYRPLAKLDLSKLIEKKDFFANEAVSARRKSKNIRSKPVESRTVAPIILTIRKKSTAEANHTAAEAPGPDAAKILPKEIVAKSNESHDLGHARNDAMNLDGFGEHEAMPKTGDLGNEEMSQIDENGSLPSAQSATASASDSKTKARTAFSKSSETLPLGDAHCLNSALSESTAKAANEIGQNTISSLKDPAQAKTLEQVSGFSSLKLYKKIDSSSTTADTSLTEAEKSQIAVNKIFGGSLPPTQQKFATQTKLRRPQADGLVKSNITTFNSNEKARQSSMVSNSQTSPPDEQFDLGQMKNQRPQGSQSQSELATASQIPHSSPIALALSSTPLVIKHQNKSQETGLADSKINIPQNLMKTSPISTSKETEKKAARTNQQIASLSAHPSESENISDSTEALKTPNHSSPEVQQSNDKLLPHSTVAQHGSEKVGHTTATIHSPKVIQNALLKTNQTFAGSAATRLPQSEPMNGTQNKPQPVVKSKLNDLKQWRKQAQESVEKDQSPRASNAIKPDAIMSLQCQRRSSEGKVGGKFTPINSMQENIAPKKDRSSMQGGPVKRSVDGSVKGVQATVIESGLGASQPKEDTNKEAQQASKRSRIEEVKETVVPTGRKGASLDPNPFASHVRNVRANQFDYALKRLTKNGNAGATGETGGNKTPPSTPAETKDKELITPPRLFRIYHCRWKDCQAELHDFQTLLKHVNMIHCGKHENGFWTCRWDGCHYATNDGMQVLRRYSSMDKLIMHMAQAHFNHLLLEKSTGVSPTARNQANANFQKLMKGDSVTPIITAAPPGWKERGPRGYESEYLSFTRRHQGEGPRHSTIPHDALSRR